MHECEQMISTRQDLNLPLHRLAQQLGVHPDLLMICAQKIAQTTCFSERAWLRLLRESMLSGYGSAEEWRKLKQLELLHVLSQNKGLSESEAKTLQKLLKSLTENLKRSVA
ncbi:hypothetical protein COW36_08845 [bacterium (Candidatus Blackallbacteria) CG17_big_fil_post_rev_8_21_14_2_50_48_46]|uniref:Uncharacterized protein n=1 Tax=bacterium (Candidatus Blackallbacteria) CG17_big_fil_post_rev_8_21_14_2_50_48_46 TaxID=2014261 RepID=A0A2M7G6F8_9BACT|nr:MAG: hypothetical protein COW64_06145 [bacterium (Candidatus Blackallbacteria) CG18_big_fil_WC_8_21_14_2_50_49_26]PIW17592.1 MAG: hypothetical protein COW36_08845 [bacterium (Candidatus Blackallbacteria) CG17_big_fil_post_rev_8_21_14_2_50_48_46]PIW48447.1 MAG: hypothetical protein COW20_10195 [bacterium (Candidatus Blackallbacteria) CG13_big_fil_rev_8_21_14_2_50_49_14]